MPEYKHAQPLIPFDATSQPIVDTLVGIIREMTEWFVTDSNIEDLEASFTSQQWEIFLRITEMA